MLNLCINVANRFSWKAWRGKTDSQHQSVCLCRFSTTREGSSPSQSGCGTSSPRKIRSTAAPCGGCWSEEPLLWPTWRFGASIYLGSCCLCICQELSRDIILSTNPKIDKCLSFGYVWFKLSTPNFVLKNNYCGRQLICFFLSF